MKKEDVAREICTLLNIKFIETFTSEESESGGGGNVTRDFFASVYEKISGLDSGIITKTDLVRHICVLTGIEFQESFTSEKANSGGGSKVTKSFLEYLRDYIKKYYNSI